MRISRIIASALATLILLNCLLLLPTVKNFLFGLSKTNYDFIGIDWLVRNRRLLEFIEGVKESHEPDRFRIFIGTSRTSYGIGINDPSILNLGYISSSFKSMVSLFEYLGKHVEPSNHSRLEVLFELNPIAYTDTHISNVDYLQYPLILPCPTPLIQQVYSRLSDLPLVQFKDLLWSGLVTIMQPSISTTHYKTVLRATHLGQLLAPGFEGHYQISLPIDNDYFEECVQMAEVSLGEGSTSFASSKVLSSLGRHNLRIAFWIPPVSPRFRSSSYDGALQALISLVESQHLRLLDMRAGFSDQDFFDCIHLNSSGSDKLMEMLDAAL